MAMASDRALCLRRHEYSESSQIVTLLTHEHGLVKTIAKGAHRTTKVGASKFDGGIDLLDEADAVFTDHVDRELNTLAEWRIVEGRRALRENLRATHLGLYLAELTTELFELHDAHPKLYRRIAHTLGALAGDSREAEALACAIDLLKEAGVMPRIAYCAICDTPLLQQKLVTVSPPHGGVVCEHCEAGMAERLRVPSGPLRSAATIWKLPRTAEGAVEGLPTLSADDANIVHRLMTRHVEETTGRRLRTGRYVGGFA